MEVAKKSAHGIIFAMFSPCLHRKNNSLFVPCISNCFLSNSVCSCLRLLLARVTFDRGAQALGAVVWALAALLALVIGLVAALVVVPVVRAQEVALVAAAAVSHRCAF